jgi:hypothetical protein
MSHLRPLGLLLSLSLLLLLVVTGCGGSGGGGGNNNDDPDPVVFSLTKATLGGPAEIDGVAIDSVEIQLEDDLDYGAVDSLDESGWSHEIALDGVDDVVVVQIRITLADESEIERSYVVQATPSLAP